MSEHCTDADMTASSDSGDPPPPPPTRADEADELCVATDVVTDSPLMSPRTNRILRVALTRITSDEVPPGTPRFDDYGFKLHKDSVDAYARFSAETIGSEDSKLHAYRQLIDLDPRNFRDRRLTEILPLGLPRIMRRSVWITVTGVRTRMLAQRERYRSICGQLDAALAFNKSPDSVPVPAELAGNERRQKLWRDSLTVIEADIRRALGSHIIEHAEMHMQRMRRILQRFALHLSDDGYCQAQHFFCVMFTMHQLSDEEAFWMLEHLALRLFPFSFDTRYIGVPADVAVLDYYVEKSFPQFVKTLADAGLTLAETLTAKLFGSLFVDMLPYNAVAVVWDSLFVGGVHEFFTVALKFVSYIDERMRAAGLHDRANDIEIVKQFVDKSLRSIANVSLLVCTTVLERPINASALNMRRQLERNKRLVEITVL